MLAGDKIDGFGRRAIGDLCENGAFVGFREEFGLVGQSTASAKARVISDALHAHRMDPAWMLPSLVDQNPLVWMAKVNGSLVDLRDMPRELQVIAYEKGMIPYVPADKE